MSVLHVEFDLPMTALMQTDIDRRNISAEIKRMVALFLYEHQQISLGKACELGGMSYWEFADANRRLGISQPYSSEDLTDDLARLKGV
ncbi:hypothetical protein U14_04596 [Candidatus Moduliflexus flocculans]|uniref:Uncharacterized protein n=1 Tax=Candidatus Moduliflexus flocculans TaxID=1499966 RepID=A0A0S6W5D2_9BACT|nr:hypothetical protein U14_04596 [Candidatus Moduliflexus flocculans]